MPLASVRRAVSTASSIDTRTPPEAARHLRVPEPPTPAQEFARHAHEVARTVPVPIAVAPGSGGAPLASPDVVRALTEVD